MNRYKLFAASFAVLFLWLSCYGYSTATAANTGMQMEIKEQVPLKIAKGKTAMVEQKETETYRQGLAAYIQSVNDQVTDGEADTMVKSILECSEKYGVDDKLVMAVAQTESTYYSDAVSCADYKGLMQTGDVLAEEAGYQPQDLFDPAVSIMIGTSYINEQLETFGDTRLALTAYNQGAGAVYSGCYDTAYADLALDRVERIEAFLTEHGYLR